jgi:glycosyltransferase involved in cell wall biosynthesis
MSTPILSILLPVYNGSPYLNGVINSVLSQSFQNFELIIINDGSTDDSESIIKKIDDSRIRYVQQQNHGLSATLNIALGLASGEFVARQDQDDISFPLRLQKQVEFLAANPDVGMVGTSAEIWVGNAKTERFLKHPVDDASIKFNLLFDNPFVHSSVMIRRNVFERVGGYSEDKTRQPPEDYELWSRVAREFKVANLPETLLAYHEVQGSMSRSGLNPFLSRVIKISAENIACYSGRDVASPEIVAVSKLVHGVYEDIPKGVSLFSMEAIIRKSAIAITKQSKVTLDHLDVLLKAQIIMLRHHYFEYLTNSWVGSFSNYRLGRYAKSILRRILLRVYS